MEYIKKIRKYDTYPNFFKNKNMLLIPLVFAVLLVGGTTNMASADPGLTILPAAPTVSSDQNGILAGVALQNDGKVNPAMTVTLYKGEHSHDTVQFRSDTIKAVDTVTVSSEGKFSFEISQDLGTITYTLVSEDNSGNTSKPLHHTVIHDEPASVSSPPEKVDGLVLSKGVDYLSAEWLEPQSSSPVTDYFIQYLTSGGEWTTWNDGKSTLLVTDITDIALGHTYQVRVAAVSDIGTGEYSSPAEIHLSPAQVEVSIPDTITDLAAVIRGDDIILSWSAPNDG